MVSSAMPEWGLLGGMIGGGCGASQQGRIHPPGHEKYEFGGGGTRVRGPQLPNPRKDSDYPWDLDLRETTVYEEFNTSDEAAVFGSQEGYGFGNFAGRADAPQRCFFRCLFHKLF